MSQVCQLVIATTLLAASPAAQAQDSPAAKGESIYRSACVRCHGEKGEGVPKVYPKALLGDRSVSQLARLIELTMPEDDPGSLSPEDSASVAAYIHESFYSPTAQARNRPARIELSRLTVRQYRNALADLVATFRDSGSWGDERGLKGQYYKSRRFRDDDRVIDRTDPEVHFDFADTSPEPEKLDPKGFSIRWEGAVLAPETGTYEFVVKTEHATRLWINDRRQPLIDAWVKSGNDTEYRASIFLLGGRPYPLKLEFSKAKQGVDDSEKTKDKPAPKASISLEWKIPGHTQEVISARNLSPAKMPQLFVCQTPFPPDDRSIGYERGTSVSKEWDQASTDGALETAGYFVDHLRELADAPDDASDREARLKAFCARFVERAFRRPLTDDQKALYVDRQFSEAADLDTAVRRVVMLTLKSPRFLYREFGHGQPDPYDVASRLAFGLWDSLPDQPLLEAAASGQLATREQVAQHAERMLPDLRTRSKLREFLQQWLKVDHLTDIAKDPKLYPEFTPEVISDLRTSLDLFIDETIWATDSSDFRQLLLADQLHLNGRLAKLYGVELPPDAPFQKVKPAEGERAGILTHPFLMAGFAYTATTSPIHRGVFIARSLLGRSLRPPPEAVSPLAPDLHPDLTTRERVILQTSPATCQTCHGLINPLGFPLENYDALGRFRKEEKGKPIDPVGAYLTRSGDSKTFASARELATFLAESDEAQAAFAEQCFHYLVKQPIRAYGPDAPAALREAFTRDGFQVRKLLVEIVARSALASQSGPN